MKKGPTHRPAHISFLVTICSLSPSHRQAFRLRRHCPSLCGTLLSILPSPVLHLRRCCLQPFLPTSSSPRPHCWCRPLPDPLQSPVDRRSRVADCCCPSQMSDVAEVCDGHSVWSRWGWSRDKCLAFPVLLQFFLSLLPPLLSCFADFWSWRRGRPGFF